jgi:hypothetical protein
MIGRRRDPALIGFLSLVLAAARLLFVANENNAMLQTVDPRTPLVYLPLQDVGGRRLLRIISAREP